VPLYRPRKEKEKENIKSENKRKEK